MKKTLTFIIATGALVSASVVPLAVAAVPSPGLEPSLAWSPATNGGYDFGLLDAGAGQTKSVTFTVTNSGSAASGALAVPLSGSSAFTKTADTCIGRSLDPKASCSVTVRYAPTTAGESDSSTLTAQTGVAKVSTPITLKGTSGTPDLILTPGTLTGTDTTGKKNYFFTITGTGLAQFQVVNVGTGTSNTLRVVPAFGDPFSPAGDACTGQKVAPSKSCSFTLGFFPAPSCGGPQPFTAFVDIFDFAVRTQYIELTTQGLSTPMHC
jgi:CARDB